MLTEIDKDFFCSIGNFGKLAPTQRRDGVICEKYYCDRCSCRHRKLPTPKQFKEEYGFDYPDDGAVYYIINYDTIPEWICATLIEAMEILSNADKDGAIVCACTPFGKPDKNWRPK